MSFRALGRAFAASSLLAAALAAASTGVLPTASATTASAPTPGTANVAPGAPLRIYPSRLDPAVPADLQTIQCSQALAGTVTLADGTEKPVMLTAGHCVLVPTAAAFSMNPDITVPITEGDVVIGTVSQATYAGADPAAHPGFLWEGMHPDWAVVDLADNAVASRLADSVNYDGQPSGQSVALTGIRDFSDLPAVGSSLDNFGQPLCKQGQTSGLSCGVQLLRTQDSVFSLNTGFFGGDSGGVTYDPATGEAVGIVSMGIAPQLSSVEKSQAIDASLQAAFGIPDGQVNAHFRLPDVVPHDPALRPASQDAEKLAQWVAQAYPDNPRNPAEEELVRKDMQRYQELVPSEIMYGSSALKDVPSVLQEAQLPTLEQASSQVPSAEHVAAVAQELPSADEVTTAASASAAAWSEEIQNLSSDHPETSKAPWALADLIRPVAPEAAQQISTSSSEAIQHRQER